jgi:hypothetical protein
MGNTVALFAEGGAATQERAGSDRIVDRQAQIMTNGHFTLPAYSSLNICSKNFVLISAY